MDWGNIIYIIAVIIYFIYTASRKKKKNIPQAPDADPSTNEEPSGGMSFEDLLREIREAQNPKKKEEPRELIKPKQEVKPEKTPLKPYKEARKPEPEISRRPEKTRASKPSDAEIPSAEDFDMDDAFERMRQEEERIAQVAASIPSQKDVNYRTKKKKVNPYATRLKNRNSIKEAVVLNEILNRKHF
ncbi:hypothetical protein [Algoriphagus sediminis]|uniref:Uncharacterized protein n=1 Tax=Algoriphagus sediminis TaxID=3057113 RepID=A0ABT7YDJ3_9BACT|nr:hypothetical protein [Algoriphagus sediminis]MDN3204567.1 hypothetical protein [Algoriphagus sediminis]